MAKYVHIPLTASVLAKLLIIDLEFDDIDPATKELDSIADGQLYRLRRNAAASSGGQQQYQSGDDGGNLDQQRGNIQHTRGGGSSRGGHGSPGRGGRGGRGGGGVGRRSHQTSTP